MPRLRPPVHILVDSKAKVQEYDWESLALWTTRRHIYRLMYHSPVNYQVQIFGHVGCSFKFEIIQIYLNATFQISMSFLFVLSVYFCKRIFSEIPRSLIRLHSNCGKNPNRYNISRKPRLLSKFKNFIIWTNKVLPQKRTGCNKVPPKNSAQVKSKIF